MAKKSKAFIYKNNEWHELTSPVLVESKTDYKEKYSSERIEVGTWIDGRKIYRKVYSGKGNVPNIVPIDPIKTVIDMRMVVKDKSAVGAWRNIPWVYDLADNTWTGGFYLDSLHNVVQMQLKTNMSNTHWWHLIVDYCIDAE